MERGSHNPNNLPDRFSTPKGCCLGNLILITGLSLTAIGGVSEVIREVKIQSQLSSAFPDLVPIKEQQQAQRKIEGYVELRNELKADNRQNTPIELERLPGFKKANQTLSRYNAQQLYKRDLITTTAGLMTQQNAENSIAFGMVISLLYTLYPHLFWWNNQSRRNSSS